MTNKKKLIITLLLVPHFCQAGFLGLPDVTIPTPVPIPRPKDIVNNGINEVKKGIKNISNELQIVIRNVKREVDQVYAANTQTIADVGRIQACITTYCVSEYIRKEEIKEVDNWGYENFVQQSAAYDQQKKAEMRAFMENQIKLSKIALAKAIQKNDNLIKSLEIKRKLLLVVETNIALRNECAKNGFNYDDLRPEPTTVGKDYYLPPPPPLDDLPPPPPDDLPPPPPLDNLAAPHPSVLDWTPPPPQAEETRSLSESNSRIESVLKSESSTQEDINRVLLKELIWATESDQAKSAEFMTNLIYELHDSGITKLRENMILSMMYESNAQNNTTSEISTLKATIAQYEKRLKHVTP